MVARLAAVALLLLAAMIVLVGPSLSGSGASGYRAGPVDLLTCITRQQPGDRPTDLFATPSRFDCARPEVTWGPGDYWLRLHLPARTTDSSRDSAAGPRILRFVPQWQRSLTFFTRDSEGTIEARQFDDTALPRLIRMGAAADLPLEDRPHPAVDIIVRVDGALNAVAILGNPRILDPAYAHAEELIATAVFAAFAGLGLGLFCYNIMLWVTIRERFQLTYCLSLLAMLAYVWASSGTMALQFPQIPHSVRLGVSYALLAYVAALALQFNADFIEPGMVPRWLRLTGRHGGLLMVSAAVAISIVPESWRYVADRGYAWSFVPLPPLVISLTATAWRRGSRAARVLAVAWVLPLAMAVVRIAHALHFIEYSWLVQFSLTLGMSTEALLSSLAMAYRIKLITEERDRALADERAARHLASIDPLTGLLNRRALLEQVLAWESPEELRLLIVDIDRFKQINDTHGHHVGDEVLREVAETLAIRADLRASVARLGGEEFALIGTVSELHEGIALGILADVRSRLMAGTVSVTVSVGMANGPVRHEDDWRELYRRADAALYRAKSEGRNRAIHAPPGADTIPAGADRAVA